MRRGLDLIFLSTVFLCPAIALALTQPNGQTIPTEPGCHGGQPTGLAATFACVCEDTGVCNIGAHCQTGTCDDGRRSVCETTMWHEANDNMCIPSNSDGLDPVAEASTTPETFTPVCPLTFTIITRGTALFQDAFGWYNATGSEPEASDLHVMLDCTAAAGEQVVLDIQGHAAYAGGEIGFFLVTPESEGGSACADGNCCASVERASAGQGHIYYSESRFNPDFVGQDSFIHLLTYDSHVWDHKFYFAWEDIHGGSNNDFTDLVTSVTGVECAGGGSACLTGQQGICSYGVNQCVGENLECVGLYTAETERCDGLDNDCDGTLDNGAICEGHDEVCHNGRCVPHCELAEEFTCDFGYFCDAETGFCVEAACVDVPCNDSTVCQGGHCVGGCEGVQCPHGQTCRLGTCMDPCAGVSCNSPLVCSEGVCVPGCGQCNGLLCEAPQTCNVQTFECEDASCDTPCGAGTHCSDGACVDDCHGVVCPAGKTCQSGQCFSAGEDGGPDAGPDAGRDGGQLDATPRDGGSDTDGSSGNTTSVRPGCACSSSGGSAAPGACFAFFVMAFVVRFLRR